MSPARKQTYFTFLTLVSDVIAIIASVVIGYAIRFMTGWLPLAHHRPEFFKYTETLIVIIPVYLAFFRAYGLYQPSRDIRRIEEVFLVIKGVTFSIVVLLAATFFYRGYSYSRIYLVILWATSIFFLVLARYYVIQWEYFRRVSKKDVVRVLLIGANRNTRSIIKWAAGNPHYGRQILGVLACNEGVVEKHFEGATILGTNEQSEEFIDRLKPDEVILLETDFARDRTTDLISFCEDRMIDFKIGVDFYGLMTSNLDVEYISTVPLLGFRDLPLDDPWNRGVKRTFDFLVAGILLLISFPVWMLVILAIKMSDRGPILYRQERMGRDQKVFYVYKFRTMKVDAEKETGPVWAKSDDSRKTAVGAFLRRWNLDELPQLWNVFKGDMSLVGPRPERPHFIDQFRGSVPRYMSRHKIKSGITGWAQVNGYRGNTSIQERIKYDLYYMENWSLLFDIEILFMTFAAFKNAY